MPLPVAQAATRDLASDPPASPKPFAAPFEAFFMPVADGGQRFALHHPPAGGAARSTVLYLPPFAEEANKVRRMAALQSRALAAAGHAVLQPDLLGCGDSSGEFEQASWSDWIDDACSAAAWLVGRYPGRPLWLWGARAGCLLASAVAERIDPTPRLLLWAPVINGAAQLQQFLRIRLAAELVDGPAKGAMAQLKRQLDEGQPVDVAGYRLSAALAAGLGRARLQLPRTATRLVWFDVSSRDDAVLAPAAESWLGDCRAAGHQVQAGTVAGPAFWQTSEIELAPELLAATLAAIEAPP